MQSEALIASRLRIGLSSRTVMLLIFVYTQYAKRDLPLRGLQITRLADYDKRISCYRAKRRPTFHI